MITPISMFKSLTAWIFTMAAISSADPLGNDSIFKTTSATTADPKYVPISEVNFPRWILNEAFDSGFSAKLMRKDVRTALELAASGGTSLDLLERAAEIWRDSTSRLPDDADFNRIAELGPPVPDETDETR